MTRLLDVNVMVALVMPKHVHHERARTWLEREGKRTGWATCLVTDLGTIRVCAQLAQREVKPWPSYRIAAHVRRLRRSHDGHWWADLKSPAKMREVYEVRRPRDMTDGYLLGFARRSGARLVTLDRELKTFGGLDVVCLLPERVS